MSKTWPDKTLRPLSIRRDTRTRSHRAVTVVGPTDNAIPAISGVTLYRVKNRVIDDDEFIPLR